MSAISLMWFVERKELISALEARAVKIKGNLEHAKYVIDAVDDFETPIRVRAMMSLLNARMESASPSTRATRRRCHSCACSTTVA